LYYIFGVLYFSYAIITDSNSFEWTLNIYFNTEYTNHLKTVLTNCEIYYHNNEYNVQVLCDGSSSCLLIGSTINIFL